MSHILYAASQKREEVIYTDWVVLISLESFRFTRSKSITERVKWLFLRGLGLDILHYDGVEWSDHLLGWRVKFTTTGQYS